LIVLILSQVSAPVQSQALTSLPASGWLGAGAGAQGSREGACAQGAARLGAAMRSEVSFTGTVRAGRKGNASYCEYEVSGEGRVVRLWSAPVYDLARGAAPQR
jgi:predicted lipoprotein